MAVVLAGQFSGGDEFDAQTLARGGRARAAFHRVMIGQGDGLEAAPMGVAGEFFRGVGAIRKIGMEMQVGEGVHLLLVDNDDCFIHTLANYARQTGARVSTFRANAALEVIDKANRILF